jgi:ring-1,2-phenylacetyl-CoA epoxidase subunit PaaE
MLLGNRFFNAIIFRDELEDLKDQFLGRFRLFHVLSGEPNDIALLAGRIDASKLEAYSQTMIDVSSLHEAFICGPTELTETSKKWLVAKGFSEEQIHFELFTSPGQKENIPPQKEVAVSHGTRCAVTMIIDGMESRFFMPMDGTTILDAAQSNKADIPFSCKGGMCCTCRAHISEGSAHMKVNYALEPGEVEAGYVLTCQAVPQTAEITVDFDRH